MTPEKMKQRTKEFALRVIRFVRSLPRDVVADVVGRQLLRSGTSVGANYRAACRARSTADFVAKLKIVEEETDESMYWIEILAEDGLTKWPLVEPLHKEADEILSIVVASINTSRHKKPKTRDA